MTDDFDSGVGMPDDELTGGSAMTDTGDAGAGGADDEGGGEPTGRRSGGARARKSGGSKSAGSARKAAKRDRKSTRLNSSHLGISYAVFCLKKKKNKRTL